MSPQEKARFVAGMFARIAGRYDLMNRLMTGGRDRWWRELTARLATRGLGPGPALDVATGTGDLALALARQPGVRAVVGLDLVGEMLARARRKAKAPPAPVAWVRGDALALPFADASFICATSAFSMRNVASVPRALAEMARVVRPGGRVAVLEIVPLRDAGPLGWAVRFYFHRLIPLLGRLVAGDAEAYRYLPASVEAFLPPEGLARQMEGAGLRGVRCIPLALGTVVLCLGERP